MVRGVVEKISPDHKVVLVRRNSFESCSTCASKAHCSTPISDADKLFTAPYFMGVKVGDTVELTITPGKRIIGSIIVFLLPLLMLIVGYLVSSKIFSNNEPAAAAGAVVFLLVTFVVIFFSYKKGLLTGITGTIVKVDPHAE